MGWIGCVHCEKFQCDLMAQTSPLIAPVQSILHRVPCSNKTLPNAPKHNKMLQNMSLVPMGCIGCVHCEKLWCDFVARTSSLIAQFNTFCTEFLVVTKHCQLHQNTTKCSRTWVWFQWGGSSVFFAKNPMQLHGTNMCINCTSSTRFAPSFV